MAGQYDALKLKKQLCFPLYACAKEVVRMYKPFLDEIGLTYTQYIALMVLWEYEKISVKELGEFLYLDSGTLTPVLKKLEQKGYIHRCRSVEDERVLLISLTEAGIALKDEAVKVPIQMGACMKLNEEEADTLYRLLYKILGSI